MSWITDTLADLAGMLRPVYLKLAHPTDATKVVDAAAGAHGGLAIEGVAGGTAVPVSGTVTASGSVTVSASALPSGAATEASVSVPGTATAITKSDATDTTSATAKGILVGGAGNLVVDGVVGGTDITIVVVAGQYVPIRAAKVKAATTATGLVGLS